MAHNDQMPSTADGFIRRELLVEGVVELVTLIARTAYDLIEASDVTFDTVTSPSGHIGTESREIDLQTNSVSSGWARLERVIDVFGPDLLISSEESPRPWNGSGPDKPTIIRLDEFDGTTIAKGVATNWSVSALVFLWSARRRAYVLAGGAIAHSDAHVISYVNRTPHPTGVKVPATGQVRIRRYDTFTKRDLGSLDRVAVSGGGDVEWWHRGDPRMVAISAAAGQVRGALVYQQFPGAFTESSFRTLFAGSPICYPAIRGWVGAIIDPEKATLHDANHLVALSFCGFDIYELDTLVKLDMVRLAEENCVPGADPQPVPPSIAVRNWMDPEEVLDRLEGRGISSSAGVA